MGLKIAVFKSYPRSESCPHFYPHGYAQTNYLINKTLVEFSTEKTVTNNNNIN